MQIGNHNPIITVVRDPHNTLGKRFDVNPDGTIRKKSAVSLSLGIAVQHHVPSLEDLAELLSEVGFDPHAAIINASFTGIPVGEEFVILSEHEFESRLGIPSSDRAAGLRRQATRRAPWACPWQDRLSRVRLGVGY